MQEWEKVTEETAATHKSAPVAAPKAKAGGISVLDLILVLLERKWFLFGGMLLISGATILISVFLLQSYYTASAVVLPSKQKMNSPLAGLMGESQVGGLLKSFDIFGGGDNSRFLSILDSRRLADKAIERFDLVHHYGFHKQKKFYYENLLKEFHKNVEVQEDQLDNINISVTDTNPQVAADMANFIVDELDSISFTISQEDARGSRVFFEERLRLMRATLDSVHQALAEFQIKHNFIDLDQQVKSSIEALAGIEAEAMATDIEKEMLASSFGNNSRMAEVQKKKEVLNRRMADYMQKGSGSLVLPLMKTPELGIQYAYLLRDVKVHETLYAFIMQMFEQAKFREANNSPVVTILEKARVPEKRARPKRGTLCILAFFVGFALLSSWILISHWFAVQRRLGTDNYYKLNKILAHFGLAR